MKAKKILYPTDFSPISEEALAYAASLAHDCGAELLIVHVRENPPAYVVGDMMAYGSDSDATPQLKQLLASSVPRAVSVDFRHVLVSGTPAEEIVRLAKEENVDLIVMATHGRTGLTHLLMGSVAEAVVRRSPCPVLAYKPQSHAQVATPATT
jgi:universal stress protein A